MIYLAVGIVVAVLGALIALAHLLADKIAERFRHTGGHCIPRPHPAVILALDLRDWALTPPAALLTWLETPDGRPAPGIPSAREQADAELARLTAEDSPPATWDEIRDGWPKQLTGEELMPPLTWDEIRAQWDEARDRWPEVGLPELRPCCPTADGEAHALRCEARPGDWAQTAALAGSHPYPPLPVILPLDTGDGHVRIDETGHVTVRRGAPPVTHPTLHDLPVVPGFGERLVYNQACQLDVAEAERHYALALGPDGCEET